MIEPPDFELKAAAMVEALTLVDAEDGTRMLRHLLEATWNARGAADIEAATSELDADTATYVDVALRRLDR